MTYQEKVKGKQKIMVLNNNGGANGDNDYDGRE
jgi:hypothetical protein